MLQPGWVYHQRAVGAAPQGQFDVASKSRGRGNHDGLSHSPNHGCGSLSLQDLGAVGELVGGIAVLVTLIYLAVQVRQASVTTHRQIYGQSAAAISEFWLDLAKDPQLHADYLRALREPEHADFEATQRGYLVLDAYFSLLESFYLHNLEYGEHASQERWARIICRILDTPGGRSYWSRRSDYFHQQFSDYVRSLHP